MRGWSTTCTTVSWPIRHRSPRAWRAFFSDYKRTALPAKTSAASGPQRPETPVTIDEGATALRGSAARIVTNMTASLTVPTATSFRNVSARLLEINRAALNESLSRTTGAKVSFTHLIAFAIVQGLRHVPALNAAFVDSVDDKGTPGVRRHEHVGLGLAVDVEKSDGTRNSMVPVIKDADTLDFRAFPLAYEDKVRKVHGATAGPDDFSGATVSLTNPGTIGNDPVGAPSDARSGCDLRRRGFGLARGLRSSRPPRARGARRGQILRNDVDLRPPNAFRELSRASF
jgi:2-oxoglutarate dehydrogenase E1 component